jgi:tripartite-type tricarboxylate transporter receptor subunit TctC
LLPEVPTMKEQGFGDFHAASWNAWVAPAGTPPEVVDRLNKAVVVATADRGVQERLGKVGVSVVPKSRADLEKFIKEEGARWRKVIEQNGIKLEN